MDTLLVNFSNIFRIMACIGGDGTADTLTNCGASENALIEPYKYIVVVTIGWVTAQLIKLIIHSVRYKKTNWIEVFSTSGGMPSSHATVIVSVATLIGLVEGFDTAIFGLAAAVVLIITYDAVKVRKSVGDQAELIGKLIKEQGSNLQSPKVVRGHKTPEVIAGCCLGILIGFLVFFLTNN